MTVKILSDSGCDLPKEIIKEYNIDILPIVVTQGDKEYLDQETIDPIQVYKGMRNGETFKTAQISPTMFQERFKKYSENDDSVIYLSLSSGLSGTYQTSVLVADSIKEQNPSFDLDIVDSKAASGGFGLIVLEAAKLAKAGKTKDEILEAIDFYKEHIEHVYTVDDIEYLFRGGRVSRTQAVLGGILNIKPILQVEDGKLVPLDKVRGKNNVYKKMIEIMEQRGKKADFTQQTIIITHGDDLDSAMKLKELIEEKFGAKTFLLNMIGAAIGAHSGPGTLALFFFSKNY